MKTSIIYTALTLLILVFTACEDVVEIALPTDEPRLVFDGLIRVDTTQEFVNVKVKVTKTNSFYEDVDLVSDLETIYIYYGTENEFGEIVEGLNSNLAEVQPGTGIYEPDPNFTSDQRIRTSDIDDDTAFWLIVEHEGRKYAAKTYYESSVPIDNVVQGDGTLFNEDQTEIVLSFTDNPDKENYYLFDFDNANFLTSEDTFYEGQAFSFSYFYDPGLAPGDEIEISILGASKDFFDYMNLLLEQSEGGFGPFATPAATVRGNVFDVTGIDNINNFNNVNDVDNFPLGYFSVSQVFSETLVIE
jgi:Domain of unknown function (DUF4249)